MLLHRHQNAQIALYPAVVVISDVLVDHQSKLLTARGPSAIVSLTLEDSSEPFHRAVVDALGDPGHALLHLCFLQLVVKGSIRILKSMITAKQWMGIGIHCDSGIQSVEHTWIVVSVTDDIGDDPAVIQVKNLTEYTLIQFLSCQVERIM